MEIIWDKQKKAKGDIKNIRGFLKDLLLRKYSGQNKNFKKIMSRSKIKRPDEILVEYFFSLKGYPEWPDSFYKENNIRYNRFLLPARDLLDLSDGSLEKAKITLAKMKKLAEDSCWDDWNLSSVPKFWLELNKLPLEEKQPEKIQGELGIDVSKIPL